MLLAALCYLLITGLLFRNLLPVLPTHVFGDLGDPLLNAAIVAWNAKHLPLSTDWWNFPAFAPLSGVTAFTEHLLGAYPLTSPIVWFTGNPVLAYNALQLLTLPLNAVAAFALVRELTGSWVGAFIGGLAFAFAPFTGEHVPHIQMLMAFGMPFALLRAASLSEIRRRSWSRVVRAWLAECGALERVHARLFPILLVLWAMWFLRRTDAVDGSRSSSPQALRHFPSCRCSSAITFGRWRTAYIVVTRKSWRRAPASNRFRALQRASPLGRLAAEYLL